MKLWLSAAKAMLMVAVLWAGTAQAGTIWLQQATDNDMYGLVYKIQWKLNGETQTATRFIIHPGLTGNEATRLHGGASMSFTGGLNVTAYDYNNWTCDDQFGYCWVFITNASSIPDNTPMKVFVKYFDPSQGRYKEDSISTHWRIGNEHYLLRYNPWRVTSWTLMPDGVLRPAAGSPKMLYEYTW